MFEIRKNLIYISKKTVAAGSVLLSKTPEYQEIATYDWTAETLPQILSTIKKKVGTKLRLLLSEDFVYVVSFNLSGGDKKNERNMIAEKARELIPEDLSKMLWDYKKIQPASDGKSGLGNRLIQVIAMKSDFYELYTSAVTLAKIKIEAVEPVSFALARLLENEKEPGLIIRSDDKFRLIACFSGLVISSETLEAKPDQNKIKEYLLFLHDHYGLEIKNIFTDKDKLNPFIGLAMKPDIKGQDQSVLNLTIESLKANADFDPDPKSFNKSKVLRTVIIMSLIYLSLIYLILSNLPKIEFELKINPASTDANLLKEDKIASPSVQIDRALYQISVLNGSKKIGEAAKLRTLLLNEGFLIETIGNADSNDYSGITIRKPEGIDQNFQIALDNVLQTLYTDVSFEVLESSEEADIEIIIGN